MNNTLTAAGVARAGLVLILLGSLLAGCSGTAHTGRSDAASNGSDGAVHNPDGAVDNPDGAVNDPDGAVDNPDGGCVPDTCTSLGHECGDWTDGCGNPLPCGDCTIAGETCNAGQCEPSAVDCSGIANHPTFELCDSGQNFCAGVFTNGEGCSAYCAAAGLQCSARYGGEPGCQQEPQNVLGCADNNGHLSDWCVCQGTNPNPTCPVDPLDPPTQQEQHYMTATYFNRSAWALTCYDYGYTAQYAEHEACDSQYSAGSGQGSATFTFTVGRGEYDVFIEGRHTDNRNPAGALVTVTSAGQTYTTYIMQRDSTGAITMDLHGRYCLEGQVVVVMDSTVSGASDSVRRVVLVPAP